MGETAVVCDLLVPDGLAGSKNGGITKDGAVDLVGVQIHHDFVAILDCPIPDVCIDERRLSLFIARATLRELIAGTGCRALQPGG